MAGNSTKRIDVDVKLTILLDIFLLEKITNTFVWSPMWEMMFQMILYL